MVKNIYMSPKEQEIFRILKKRHVISHESIATTFPEEKNMNKIIHGLISKGYLYKLKRGLYLVFDDAKMIIENPFKIGLSMFPGYIGMSSALNLHGLLDYESFTVFIITPDRSEERKVGNYLFKAINLGRRAEGECLLNGLYVSTPAKTLFDCFFKPGHTGYPVITKAIYESDKKICWNEFLDYFKKYASNSLCQRTGYILEELNRETKQNIVPERIISYLYSRVSAKTRILPSDKKSGKYIRKWKVMDNSGKRNFLSWWFNG